jgi:hypothetical protein
LGFNSDQISEIEYGVRYNLDISKYAKKKFTAGQMRVIKQGLQRGVDVDAYTNPDYTPEQMDWFLKALIKYNETKRGKE